MVVNRTAISTWETFKVVETNPCPSFVSIVAKFAVKTSVPNLHLLET